MAGTSNSSSSSDSKDSRWYFTAEQLANSPSRRHGIDADQELSYRQLTAYLIQEMGQRLQVSQLCINTAIVYMHRFYAFHSFTHFHRNGIAAASLFLAAKVEEQPRKLEHVIKVAHICLSQDAQPSHPSPELYVEQAQDLVFNENVLLQTLGFDVAIDHPHTHVVKTCHLVKACKDLAQTSYFLASNSLHLTPMCLQYRPTVVACFCIYLACKWSRWEIPQSTEGKHWFHYVDKTVTMDLLKQLTDEFIVIYEKSPARLKSKLNSIKALAQGARISEPSRPIPESSGNASASAQPETQRRPESIPSHHRTHHSSSHSGSSHHHSKQILSTDGGDHINKSNQLHKPHTSSSHSNRPRQERPERSDRVERSDRPDRPERTERTDRPIIAETQIPPHPSVRPINPAGSMRPTNVNRPGHPMLPVNLPPPSQRPIHPHDPAYHKNRYPNTALKPKSTDPQRHMMKEPTGRPMDPNKTSVKHPNSAYTTQNVNPGTIDMSRTGMSSQGPTNLSSRSYIPPNNMQPPNYNLTGPVRSSSSNSNNINTSNMKYEQSVQQQTPLQNTQKQSSESSFSTASFKQNEDILKHEQMELCSPTRTTFVPPSQTTSHLGSAKSGSMFSPEWNVPSSLNPTLSNNGNTGSFKQINQNNMKMSRDSPKKSDREKRSETPKKEKIRNEMMGQDMTKSYQPDKRNVTKKISDNSANTSSQSNINMQFENKGSMSVLGTKRPFSNLETVVKSEDDFLRDCKARKMDNLSPSRIDHKIILPFPYDNSGPENVKCIKPFTSTINGTETNPDFVSSLLKESLCSESKLSEATAIKNEPFMELEEIKPTIQQSFSVQQQSFQHQPQQNQPSFHQPSTNIQNPVLYQQQQQHLQMVQQQQQQQQQAISMTQRDESISQYKQNLQHQQQHILPQQEFMLDYSMVKAEQGSIIHQATQQQIDTQTKDIQIETASDEYSKSKSEKKKKKDKHKHKEKEKSKDKEEKKKHKKEKDKHKERDRSSGNEQEQNPVKIKIPKDKLNLPPTDPQIPPVSGFKIKIPKDKIKKELGSTYATEESSTSLTVTQPPPSSLKIKISKDKIENYSHHPHSSSSNYHSHGSAKKKDKDRDRERDKEKKKSSEFNKQNGNNGSNNGAGGPSGTSVTKSQSSNSNKIQLFTSNMSQLFGESYDDDTVSSYKQIPSNQQGRISNKDINMHSHLSISKNYQGSKQ